MSAKFRRSAISSIVAVAMVGSLSFAPALASAQQETQDLTTGAVSVGVPEWAIDDGGNAQQDGLAVQAEIPEAYDLRTEGLVTPVKFQNPWGSCWAFGGTAAAETSILSMYGTSYEDFKLDLSERHLTYFALQPVSEDVDSAQVGEGLHTLDPSANAAFDAGGQPVYITTLYSQGVGPMEEINFPYHGKEGLTMLEYVEQHTEEAVKNQVMKETGMTWDEYVNAAYAYSVEKNGYTSTKDVFEAETLDNIANTLMNIATASPQYSDQDDWSIPATNDNGGSSRLISHGWVLKNGNVLPAYWEAATDEDPSETSKDAIKQELLGGHGVTIMYYADQGGQYSVAPGQSANGNMNHNQYVYAAGTGVNHGVEIVGWDDGYAKENFAHGSTPEAQAATTPKGDGAWIVKNSWGSETDATEENADDLGNVMNKGTFGNLYEGEDEDKKGKATGFFYLSYYDKSIKQVESMEFSENLGTEDSFGTLQYDYMPASAGFYTMPASDKYISSANVFTADDIDIAVKSVSTRTSESNTRVTFTIYQLNDNAKDPTDGEPLYRTSQNFVYGGFHRFDLDKPITFKAGTKFSVISTASTLDKDGKRKYSVSASRGLSENAAKYVNENQGAKQKAYSVAVVNKGESYLYDGNKWQDWSEYLAALLPDKESKEIMSSDTYTEVLPVDNFSIKAYVEPVDNSQAIALEEAQKAQKAAEDKATAAEKKAAAAEKEAASSIKANPMTVKAKTVTANATKKTSVKKAKAFAVKNAKGKVSFYKVSGNAKIAVNKAGNVTVKKGLKAKKTYKVKVLVAAAGGKVKGKRYAPAYKTVTLKVKVK